MNKKKKRVNITLSFISKQTNKKNLPIKDKKGGMPAKERNRKTKTLKLNAVCAKIRKLVVILKRNVLDKNKIEKKVNNVKTYIYIFNKISTKIHTLTSPYMLLLFKIKLSIK